MKLSIDVLKSIVGNGRIDHRGDLYVPCPWCNESEFAISTVKDNHPFNCVRKSKCGESGYLYKILKKFDRLDLLSGANVKSIQFDQKLEDIITKKLEREELKLDVPTIELPLGFKRIKSNYYLENRGFELFDKYEVGTTRLLRKFKDRVILIVRENNEVKGYLGRLTIGKEELKKIELSLGKKIPKYVNSTGTEFSKILGGIDEINEYTEEVMLVEGMLGKEGVDRNLKIDEKSPLKCCCTFGAKLSEEQIFKLQLRGIRKIVLFFDIDAIKVIKKHSIELLNEFDSVKIIYSTFKKDDGTLKDPADVNEIEMESIMKNHTDPINFYLNKVHILKLK